MLPRPSTTMSLPKALRVVKPEKSAWVTRLPSISQRASRRSAESTTRSRPSGRCSMHIGKELVRAITSARPWPSRRKASCAPQSATHSAPSRQRGDSRKIRPVSSVVSFAIRASLCVPVSKTKEPRSIRHGWRLYSMAHARSVVSADVDQVVLEDRHLELERAIVVFEQHADELVTDIDFGGIVLFRPRRDPDLRISEQALEISVELPDFLNVHGSLQSIRSVFSVADFGSF